MDLRVLLQEGKEFLEGEKFAGLRSVTDKLQDNNEAAKVAFFRF